MSTKEHYRGELVKKRDDGVEVTIPEDVNWHKAEYKGNVNCPACGNKLKITQEFWFPAGQRHYMLVGICEECDEIWHTDYYVKPWPKEDGGSKDDDKKHWWSRLWH